MACHLFTKQNKAFFIFFILFFCAWCHSEGAAVCCGKFWVAQSLKSGQDTIFEVGARFGGGNLGQKGPPRDSCLYCITSGLDVSRQRPCKWIFGPCCRRLLFCLFYFLSIRPLATFCLFCRQSDPLNTHLVGFCMLTPTPSDPAVFPCSMFRFMCPPQLHRQPEHQGRRLTPPKTRSPRFAVFTYFSNAALLRRVSSRAPRFVYSETKRRRRRVCGSRMSEIVADNKGYRLQFLNTVR